MTKIYESDLDGACKNCPEPIEKQAKTCKKYPDQVDMINKSILSSDHNLPHMGVFDEKQIKYMIPQTNKKIIFMSPDEIPRIIPGIKYKDGCLYTMPKTVKASFSWQSSMREKNGMRG